MILNNLYIAGGGNENKSIIINKSSIQNICNENEITNSGDIIITFENAIAFPGLINSHDHLEFNLFPALGNRIYKNYIEWGHDIHKANKNQIEFVLKIPFELRYKWGIYKNLFSGVTTVLHHGNIFKNSNEIIDVFTGGKIFHSVKLEKYWKLRINLPGHEPVVMHIGEGTDNYSKDEIETLKKWNFFKKKIIGVHAIALQKENTKYFQAIVWCPVSNYFLFDETADICELKEGTKIIFGTDSAVSAAGNIWQHLRFARKLNMLDDKKLFDSITITPAEVWNLKSFGAIKKNYTADIVIAKNKFNKSWDSFYSINPEDIILILKGGKIILWDEEIKNQLNFLSLEKKHFSKILLSGKMKYVAGNLKALFNSILKYNPQIQFPYKIEIVN